MTQNLVCLEAEIRGGKPAPMQINVSHLVASASLLLAAFATSARPVEPALDQATAQRIDAAAAANPAANASAE